MGDESDEQREAERRFEAQRLDTQIIADTFQTVCDASAYNSMIESWDRKLALEGFAIGALHDEDDLRRHYGTADSMLKRSSAPIAQDPLEAVVEELAAPAVLVDTACRVVTANEAGRRVFGSVQGMTIPTGWLLEEEEPSFRALVQGLATDNVLHAVFRTRRAEGPTGLAEAFPVNDPVSGGTFLAIRSLDFVWNEQVDAVLARAFALTPSEIVNCRLLIQGGTIGEIARQRGVAVRTVRIQLSSIFAKTGTSGQVDLVRILSMLCARMTQRPGPLGISWTEPLGTETILQRPDGRKLAFAWMGDAEGKPALLLHGFLNGYLFPPEFEALLSENGIKLYAMQRPGMGHSEADPKVDMVEDIADAVDFLCRRLCLDRVVAVGIATSAIPLAVLAARQTHPLAAIVGQGRFLPYSPDRAQRIPREQRTIQWLAIHAPWAADIVLRNGLRAMRQHGVDWLVERTYCEAPIDLESWRNPEVMPLIRNACALSALQGHRVLFEEIRMRTADYAGAMRELRIPFHWLHGAVDLFGNSPDGENFYSTREVDQFLGLNPAIELHRVAEAGDLMFYQRPEFAAQFIADLVHRCADVHPA